MNEAEFVVDESKMDILLDSFDKADHMAAINTAGMITLQALLAQFPDRPESTTKYRVMTLSSRYGLIRKVKARGGQVVCFPA